jgi:hypothetical protein
LRLHDRGQAKGQSRHNEPENDGGFFHSDRFLLIEQTDLNRCIGLLTAHDHRFSRLNIY